MVKERTILLPEGSTSVASAELAYVNILRVSREGFVQQETSFISLAAGRFYYRNTFGFITFSSDTPGASGGEKINVLYETD